MALKGQGMIVVFEGSSRRAKTIAGIFGFFLPLWQLCFFSSVVKRTIWYHRDGYIHRDIISFKHTIQTHITYVVNIP